MSSLIQQRRAMYEQMMQDDYPGVDFGYIISGGYYEPWVCVVTDYVEIPATCASITIRPGLRNAFGNIPCAPLYDANKVRQNNIGLAVSNSTRTMTFTAGAYAYIRLMVDLDDIDNCYIKDDTNNQYLWKGKNVV